MSIIRNLNGMITLIMILTAIMHLNTNSSAANYFQRKLRNLKAKILTSNAIKVLVNKFIKKNINSTTIHNGNFYKKLPLQSYKTKTNEKLKVYV